MAKMNGASDIRKALTGSEEPAQPMTDREKRELKKKLNPRNEPSGPGKEHCPECGSTDVWEAGSSTGPDRIHDADFECGCDTCGWHYMAGKA